ncbi:PLP-dependent aminotransferase family protein [Enterococcus sp. DIV0187]|uniref:aminotransferase-like domain-containing protein n=1 Tax=Enterococcus sp. DIV0187 TaxID=2774644 RepID=UPI003F1EDD49
MSVNSFENFPLSWKPDISSLKSPMYASLSSSLEKSILSGALKPNTKLPPQRELADFLNINLSTVTRAFKICETKGLIYGMTGKGTFVSPNVDLSNRYLDRNNFTINLGLIKPCYKLDAIITKTTKKILRSCDSDILFKFDNTLNSDNKAKACFWLSNFGISPTPESIVLTSSTQNALVVTLLSLFKPGDKIAVDNYTYPNFISLAKQLNIQLISIESDVHGMLPDELEKKSNLLNIRGVFLMPSCSNPTGTTLHLDRRKKLSSVIQRHDLFLIEDDTYAFISEHSIPPMATLIPDNTIYIHGVSKSLASGIRLAFLIPPDDLRSLFIQTSTTVDIGVSLLHSKIINDLIGSGDAKKIIEGNKKSSRKRNKLYKQIFVENDIVNIQSFFQWLPLPVGYSGREIELEAKKLGVEVFCSDRFSVGDSNKNSFLRISTCTPCCMSELECGLKTIHDLLKKEPPQKNKPFYQSY